MLLILVRQSVMGTSSILGFGSSSGDSMKARLVSCLIIIVIGLIKSRISFILACVCE